MNSLSSVKVRSHLPSESTFASDFNIVSMEVVSWRLTVIVNGPLQLTIFLVNIFLLMYLFDE